MKRSHGVWIAGVLALAACTADALQPREADLLEVAPRFHAGGPSAFEVTDLRAVNTHRHATTLRWTQVDDGTGAPALYRVKYTPSPLEDWKQAMLGCDVEPDEGEVGADTSCTVGGLEPETDYDFQLMSYRVQDGSWAGGVYSNIASAATAALDAPDAVDDLAVTDVTDATLTVKWTQVNDGTGAPAAYQVQYTADPSGWADASVGCAERLEGTEVGAEMACAVEGLHPSTLYRVRVLSWRGLAAGDVAAGDEAPVSVLYSNVEVATTAVRPTVRDLEVVGASPTSLTLSWTQIHDGRGEPARYRVKYAESPLRDWKNATIGCDRMLVGEHVGEPLSCTIEGLASSTTYDVQLMSYRMVDGVWAGAEYSNVATATTVRSRAPVWVDRASLASAPRSGPVWEALLGAAEIDCGVVDISDPERYTHLCVMTKALLYAATGDEGRRDEVVGQLTDFSDEQYTGTAWVLGREVPAYVIAADLIDLQTRAPELDTAFRAQLLRLRDTPTDSGPADLVRCHEERPNNWGTHCGAARTAIAAYLGDAEELERVATVFKGWLGDRSAYAEFVYGGPEDDLSWQCDAAAPLGVNPAGCTKDGHPIGGVLPDDQRRSGPFAWPPPRENYVWEALQGALVQAVILHNAGYTPFEWGDSALLRAVTWLYDEAAYPAEGDDQWVPHAINHFYGTTFAAPSPANPGKVVAWVDWMFQ